MEWRMFGPCRDGDCGDCAGETRSGRCACDCHGWEDGDAIPELVLDGSAAPYYTIDRGDVGIRYFHVFGHLWLVEEFIGTILPQDVGKRVYQVGDILQVENDEQRDARVFARRGEVRR